MPSLYIVEKNIGKTKVQIFIVNSGNGIVLTGKIEKQTSILNNAYRFKMFSWDMSSV